MIAETAQLIISLFLKDEIGPGAASATAELDKTEAAATRTKTSVSGLSRASAGAHGAFTHLKGSVGGLAGSVGLLGLGGGVLALTGYFRHAIGSAADFSATVDRMIALTGGATAATSQLTDAIGYYGIENSKIIQITGMYEKNLANLTKTKKDAAKFTKEYGFSLVDAQGHVKSMADTITTFTQYFNDKTIPTQLKIAAGAKLFGRSYQDLIPIFQQGNAEWQKQLQNGYKMTDAQRLAAHNQREASKAWNDALGDFTNTVGFKLMPTLTTLAKTAADWLNNTDNQNTLLGFLDQGITLAGNLGSFIGGTVIPTIKGLASTAVGFWNTIPGPLKDLLIKGFVADRTINYLFGFSVTGAATGVITGLVRDAVGGVVSKLTGGSFFQRGSPGNPQYVKVIGGIGTGTGGGGSGETVVTGGGGGGFMGTIKGFLKSDLFKVVGGLLLASGGDQLSQRGQGQDAGTTVGGLERVGGSIAKIGAAFMIGGPVLAVITAGVEAFNTATDTLKVVGDSQASLQKQADNAGTGKTAQQAMSDLATFTAKISDRGAFGIGGLIGDTFGGKQTIDALTNLGDTIVNGGKLSTADTVKAIGILQDAQKQAIARGNADAAKHIGADITTLQSRLKAPLTTQVEKLTEIANQPTQVNVTANTTVNSQVSTRDVQSAYQTSTRWGVVAAS